MPIQFDPELNNEYEFPDGTPPEEAQRAMNQMRQVAQAQSVLGPLGQAANQLVGGEQHPMGAPPSPSTAFAMGPEWYQMEMQQREGARQHQVESQQQQQYMQQQQQQHQDRMGVQHRQLTQQERQAIKDRMEAIKDREAQIKMWRAEHKLEQDEAEWRREQAEWQREQAEADRQHDFALLRKQQAGSERLAHIQGGYRTAGAGGAGGAGMQPEVIQLRDFDMGERVQLEQNAGMMEELLDYHYHYWNPSEQEEFETMLDRFSQQNPNSHLGQRWERGKQLMSQTGQPLGQAVTDTTTELPDPAAQYPDAEEVAARAAQEQPVERPAVEPEERRDQDYAQRLRSEYQALRARNTPVRGQRPQPLSAAEQARLEELEQELQHIPTPWQRLTDRVSEAFRPTFYDERDQRLQELRARRQAAGRPNARPLTSEEEAELEELERQAQAARRVGEPQPQVRGIAP